MTKRSKDSLFKKTILEQLTSICRKEKESIYRPSSLHSNEFKTDHSSDVKYKTVRLLHDNAAEKPR